MSVCLNDLKNHLPGHEVKTVPEMGWAGKKNGELLRLMQSDFDVFITIDSNMEYQQQLKNKSMSFVLLAAKNNKLESLLPLMQGVLSSLKNIQPGDIVRIND